MSVEVFLSTLSLRRATNNFFNCRFNIIISIHALLAESDHTLSSRVSPLSNFYPRSPCGERHAGRFQPVRESGFLSTLSLRRATARRASRQQPAGISIHALLAESDRCCTPQAHIAAISIHALLAESDVPQTPQAENQSPFLSTLSLRRATPLTFALFRPLKYFYPRSPCGERLTSGQNDNDSNNISIHALLAESDASFFSGRSCFSDFYPRSPCGERRSHYSSSRPLKGFLSTLSLRRATIQEIGREACAFISIHALLAESDALQQNIQAEDSLFLSTLSLRRATVRKNQVLLQYSRFLSTLSLRRATDGRNAISPVICISIHALLAESDSTKLPSGGRTFISIHALLAESDLSCNANINFTT